MSAIRWALFCVVLATVLTGCGRASQPATRPVTLVLDWTPNTNHAGVYLARANGAYARAGLDVAIIEPDLAGGLAQVAADNADFAFSYAEQLLPARAAGVDAISVATILTTNTSSLVSPTARGIRRPRDLEGKRYGTYGGAIEAPLVRALVRCDGGDPAKVTFIDVGNTDYAVGFAKNAYDAVWAFDGWDVIRLRDIDGTAIATIPLREHFDCIPDWYTPILTTSTGVATRDPALVRSFLAATAEGYRAAARDPQAAADALIAAVPESDRALVERSARFLAPYYGAAGGTWGRQDPLIWRGFATFLTANGIVPEATDPAAAFTNAYLPDS